MMGAYVWVSTYLYGCPRICMDVQHAPLSKQLDISSYLEKAAYTVVIVEGWQGV